MGQCTCKAVWSGTQVWHFCDIVILKLWMPPPHSTKKQTSIHTVNKSFLWDKTSTRWKEHNVSSLVSFSCLCESSLLSEINRAFTSHSSGSCASNYPTYAIKHSKYPGPHKSLCRCLVKGNLSRGERAAGCNSLLLSRASQNNSSQFLSN